MTGQDPSPMQDWVRRFHMALDNYAAALQDPDNNAAVVRSRGELRAAARGFAEASMAATGWGNPFVQLEKEVPEPPDLDMLEVLEEDPCDDEP